MNIKKIIQVIILVIIVILITIGVFVLSSNSLTKSEALSEISDIVITEDLFLFEINEVQLNYGEYIGQTITYEGYIDINEINQTMMVGREFYCCGYDSYMIGFEVDTIDVKELSSFTSIKNDDWVRIRGTIEVNSEQEGNYYPIVKLISIEKTEEGQRLVNY